GRRLSAIEHRVVAADIKGQQRVETMLGEIGELGTLVRQLAVSVAEHEDVLSGFGSAPAAVNADNSPSECPANAADSKSGYRRLNVFHAAIEWIYNAGCVLTVSLS
ncbi:MAG TPA: hypothetical protein PLM89_10225, partial [Anaerolineales bacterium]|nr:hypothetical protein [Anaerolineales bacterium]